MENGQGVQNLFFDLASESRLNILQKLQDSALQWDFVVVFISSFFTYSHLADFKLKKNIPTKR